MLFSLPLEKVMKHSKNSSSSLDRPRFLNGLSSLIGTTATQQEIEARNNEINPRGAGLPPGTESVQEGETVYLKNTISS